MKINYKRNRDTTPEDKVKIAQAFNAGVPPKELAKKYNLHVSSIYRILNSLVS